MTKQRKSGTFEQKNHSEYLFYEGKGYGNQIEMTSQGKRKIFSE